MLSPRAPAPRPTTAALALLLLGPALGAMDDDILGHDSDFRVLIGYTPGIRQAEVKNSQAASGMADPGNDGTTTFSQEYGPWFETDLMFRTPRSSAFGLVGGPGFFFNWVRGSETVGTVTEDRKLTSFGLLGSFGPTYQWSLLRLEVLAFAGGGTAEGQNEFRTATFDVRNNSHHGYYLTYGLKAGIYADSQQGLLGLQAGYQAFRSEISFPTDTTAAYAFDTSKDTISGTGLIFGFVAGVAF